MRECAAPEAVPEEIALFGDDAIACCPAQRRRIESEVTPTVALLQQCSIFYETLAAMGIS